MSKKKIWEFRWDHTPVLTVYDTMVDAWDDNCTHEEFLDGILHQTVIHHFGDDALNDALEVVKKYKEDPTAFKEIE